MKKLYAILLLICVLVTSLVACNQDGPSTETQSKNEDSSTVDSTTAKTDDTADVTTTDADTTEPEDTTSEPETEIPDHVITPAEGEVILSLYKTGELTGWLDNNGGNNLTIEERYGVQALTHAMAPTSIAFKKKFSIDWTKYQRENIYIVIDIYIDETPLIDDYRGTIKIKNGDRDDSENTSENNQLNFNVVDLKLKGGWNSYVLPLSEAIPDKGDDYTIADWFCLWINGLGVPYEVGIGRVEIVNNPTA